MNSIFDQISRYTLVGFTNAIIGLGVIAVLTYSGVDPFISNISGYTCGLINSFFMNRSFTFRKRRSNGQAPRFFFCFITAYALNILALKFSSDLVAVHILLPQIVAMLVYNVVFFILMKLWIFAEDD